MNATLASRRVLARSSTGAVSSQHGVLMCAVTVASIVAASHASAAQATMGFRGAARDGQFAGELPSTRPSVAWTFTTNGPVRSSPLLVEGVIVFGSGDGNLYSLDASTGRERWRFATGGPVDGSPAYAAPRASTPLVVVASRDGFLHAVDATNGRERWKLAPGTQLPLRWGWGFI